MPRARQISPEFWTSEAVVDCAPMTRLLLLGLANFADDFGVLPLRPRTVRLQVFPGDAIDDDQVRAMLDALTARGLLRRYAVDGVDYLAIVDWAVHQRVGRHARRRYPADPATVGHEGVVEEGLAVAPIPLDHSEPQQSPVSDDAAPDAVWLTAVEAALRRVWGGDLPADLARHALRWRAEGRDLVRDIVPAVERAARVAADGRHPLRLQTADAVLALTPAAFPPASAPSGVVAPTP